MNFEDDFTMTINGRPVIGYDRFPVENPATGAAFAHAPDCSERQLDEAVAAARAAFPAWSGLSFVERIAYLQQAADALRAHADPLMRLLTLEQGKPHANAMREVLGSALWLESVARYEPPVTVTEDSDERRSETRHVPIGVVGAISPWNFPLQLAFWKIAPALAAGNTMVLKPSPFAPLTVLKAGELLRDILPAGVLNVVSGGDALGPWLTAHPGIGKISFTGSTQVGRRVMESAAPTLKRVTLELGGNDPAIVLPDVDVPAVARQLFTAAFDNVAQVCIATKRLYVHDAIYDEMARELVKLAETVKIGDGSEQGTELGPLQNRRQYERVIELLDDARQNDLRFFTGGAVSEARAGYFVPITIVDNPPEDSRVVAEEAFGPILPMLRFSDVDDVIARANASEYGLGASVWSGDVAAASAIAARIEAGTVWVNEAKYLTPYAGFAGHKQSGLGVEHGAEGLLEYTNVRTMTVRNPRG